MKKPVHILLILVASSIGISGCIGIAVPTDPPPSSTPITPSATVAFPTLRPTSTFTPPPSATPTAELPIGPGSLVFSDGFTTLKDWTALELAPGGIGVSDGRLVVSVRQANSLFMAISPVDPLGNAFFEVDVRPELCTQNDEFGLAFRVNEAFEHYRFTLTCEGKARVVGVIDGTERILVPDTTSTTIFPGLFLTNRLGVQMEDEQFRFFINGEEVFNDRDLALSTGRIGVVVRARQGGQTTASFDDFSVRLLETAPTPTPTDGS